MDALSVRAVYLKERKTCAQLFGRSPDPVYLFWPGFWIYP